VELYWQRVYLINRSVNILFSAADGFKFLNKSKAYFKPIFEMMSWDDAYQKCQESHPNAHLAIIPNDDAFQQLHNYVLSMNGQ
jgi:hypothetical protein